MARRDSIVCIYDKHARLKQRVEEWPRLLDICRVGCEARINITTLGGWSTPAAGKSEVSTQCDMTDILFRYVAVQNRLYSSREAQKRL